MDGKELWLPLANLVSICALLVWFPDNPDDTITRLLFPGSTPQNKVLRGLEKLKELEFMQKPVCASRSIRQPAPVAPASQTEKKEAMKAMAAGLGHRMTSSRSSSGRTTAAAASTSATEKSDISSKKMSSSRSERVNVKRPTPRTSAASAASEAVSSGPRSPKRKPEDKAQKERRNQAAGMFENGFWNWGQNKRNAILQVNKSRVRCSKEKSL